MKDYNSLIKELKSRSNPKNIEAMARFGINPKNALGISMPSIRKMAKTIGKDHDLAQKLWNSKIHEARILAGLIADPKLVTEEQMETWVKDLYSWDVCDQLCMNLFRKTEFAWKKVYTWAKRDEEFVKRAGFALMATLAVHDKKAPDKNFIKFLPDVYRQSTDERNFVKKAVNWSLRQIGKRNLRLNAEAIHLSKEMLKLDSKSAKWIANDALRELTSPAVQKRLKNKL